LGKGERVWGLADLNQSMHIGGDDKVDVYLLFSTSHDGSLSYNFRIVTIRVVCENTLGMALGANTRASFTVRHTANADQRITDAHKVLANLGTDITRMEDKLNFLAQRKMTREAMTTIMDRLFPKTEKEKDGEIVLESSTRRENLIAEVLKTYEMNDGNAFPEQRGTAWNLLNAVTAWTDHQRSAKDDGKRAEAAMFGTGDILKSKAFEVIMEQSQKLAPTATAVKRSYSSGSGTTGSSLLDSVADSTVGSRN
jgi:phage/plasmid-like protein (TIGR03299 family)